MPGPDLTVPLEEEYYNHLSVVAGPYFALDCVNGVSNLITLSSPGGSSTVPPLFVGAGPLAPSQSALNPAASSTAAALLQGGEDGLAGLTVDDFIGGLNDLRGLRILQEIDEVAMLCAPDAVYQARPNAANSGVTACRSLCLPPGSHMGITPAQSGRRNDGGNGGSGPDL